jgi:hypothetical protein
MFRSRDGLNPDTGKWPLVSDTVKGYQDLPVKVPCGHCIGCRLDRSRNWAIRCVHEASLHKENCFITLTFDDEKVGRSAALLRSLEKREYVLFMYRFRDRLDSRIRFFHCGEYGSLNLRPHHHAIIFGYDFPDKVLWSERQGVKLFRSQLLEELWPYGYSTIGAVTYESCAYVARYIFKKVNGEQAAEHYGDRMPEYVTMSRRPGIASEWIKKFKDDVYPQDYVIIRNSIKCRPPRYYDNIYDEIVPGELSKIKQERKKRSNEHTDDNTRDRLLVREKSLQCKLDKLVRNL